MPSRSSFSAARMPSQVLAILIRTRSRSTPASSYSADQAAGLGERALGVEAEAGVDLGRDPAGDDLEDLAAEGDEQPVHERLGLRGLVAALLGRLGQRLLDEVGVPASAARPGRAARGWSWRPAACSGRSTRCRRCRRRRSCISSASRGVTWRVTPLVSGSGRIGSVRRSTKRGLARPARAGDPDAAVGGEVFEDLVDGLGRIRRAGGGGDLVGGLRGRRAGRRGPCAGGRGRRRRPSCRPRRPAGGRR